VRNPVANQGISQSAHSSHLSVLRAAQVRKLLRDRAALIEKDQLEQNVIRVFP